jgi:hypothetical protein
MVDVAGARPGLAALTAWHEAPAASLARPAHGRRWDRPVRRARHDDCRPGRLGQAPRLTLAQRVWGPALWQGRGCKTGDARAWASRPRASRPGGDLARVLGPAKKGGAGAVGDLDWPKSQYFEFTLV